MSIFRARPSDLDTVLRITHDTINEIYPRYYPRGAVDFFLAHHSAENVGRDIAAGAVYLLTDEDGCCAGTVTIRDNEILRLFVLPQFQGSGYGGELLRFAETTAAERCSEIILDASLAAKAIYLKYGYSEKEYHTIETADGSFLCYDVMSKQAGACR